MNIFTARKFLTLKPFDVTTEQGYTDERYRLAVLSIGANVLSRGVAMVVMVLTVSLTIPYLGAERFGVWMTIASFAGVLSFLDLGVGNALTNKVAHSATLSKPDLLRSLISGGLGFLFIVGSSMSLALAAITFVLPWESLIKVQDKALYPEIRQAVVVFALLFGLQIISGGVQRIFAGLQRAFEGHMVNAVGSIVSLVCLWVVTQRQGGVVLLLCATSGVQIFITLFLIFLLRRRKLVCLLGLLENIKRETPDLIKVGGLFFLLQIGVMISTGADSLIISSNLGVTQVASFWLVQRLFQFASQPMSIMNAPLWSVYADADARGDKKFIKNTLIFSLKSTALFSITVVSILIVFGSEIITLWTKREISIPFSLLLIYGIWSILETTGTAFAMFMNGCGIVRPQVITTVIFSIVSIVAKIYAIKYHGLEAMILSLIISYTFIEVFMYGFYFRDSLKEKIN
jgi:O-antigen/teichoic acid export membrane protein